MSNRSTIAAHLQLQYEELEKRKAEAEEKVTYIFSRKKAITQGGQTPF